MNVAIDEYGRPFVIVREQEKKRITGLEAHKANILAAKSVCDTLRTSLGPKGMDKIIVGADNEVTVTNDGATILEKMEIEHKCAKLLVDLSKSQDAEVGDGTTGVVILAGALLTQALKFLDQGLHPLHIADGYDRACAIAIERLESIAKPINLNDKSILERAAYTSLGSKVVSSQQELFARIAVEAVLSVADLERKDVNLDLIKVEGKAGGRLEDTCIVKGIVLNKELSHSQMKKETKHAKIAILTCPFEPPKPKTKNKVEITTAEHFKNLQKCEQDYFVKMIDMVQKSGANFVICQWGFDDEANHLLAQRGIPAVRWVGGVEMELIAIATGGKIVARFENLTPDKLGEAKLIREISWSTENTQVIYIEGCKCPQALTILVRGGNQMAVEEAERCIHDAICCVRNLIRDNRVVAGGGAPEIAAAIAVEAAADEFYTVYQHAIRGFAESLLALPLALADNSGLDAYASVNKAKAKQLLEQNENIGIDCHNMCPSDMYVEGVYETLYSKIQQISLATQVVKMILKIDDVIESGEL
ncbi:T-complex protein 1 subunit epsilon [Babesia microti strain RI]|uniref:T-complex protein 1 subunit epsilon n=1 Tax=Babesia microti (strain RI) TaxID=1133968 RepID=I7IHP2_BABMR|nr:T-complex protein 1 subunit epsilon [Babesia microti strain RI]CCF76157.2 T-complex protein 1 subunit epsilon [Babesia microti strain RI]|eukprot:XP_021337219.1 T-complex protein 1 subunit epsilon [Babesia microti strain RI]